MTRVCKFRSFAHWAVRQVFYREMADLLGMHRISSTNHRQAPKAGAPAR